MGILCPATANDVTMVNDAVYTAGGEAECDVNGDGSVANVGKISNPLGNVDVTATTGSISDVTAAEDSSNENISGVTVTLVAATGIGASGAATDIDTATTLVSSVTGTGGIYITETDGVALGATSVHRCYRTFCRWSGYDFC